jgi:hypothetical protein
MKNRLTDLNDALFAQLERLTDENLTAEQITTELQRTTSVVQLADRIVDTARLQLDGARFIADNNGSKQLPASLGLPSGAPKP